MVSGIEIAEEFATEFYPLHEAAKHWPMGNGQGENYMQIGDLVVVPNVPDDGLFTICRIKLNFPLKLWRI